MVRDFDSVPPGRLALLRGWEYAVPAVWVDNVTDRIFVVGIPLIADDRTDALARAEVVLRSLASRDDLIPEEATVSDRAGDVRSPVLCTRVLLDGYRCDLRSDHPGNHRAVTVVDPRSGREQA